MKVLGQNEEKEYYLEQHTRKETLHHFMTENVSRRTIYSVFSRFDNNWQYENYKKKPGRPKKLNANELRKLKSCAETHFGASTRKLAAKFQVCHKTISNNFENISVRYYKIVTPRYTEKQCEKIPKKCHILHRKFLSENTVIVMDDEKYFGFSNGFDSCNHGFYAANKENVPTNVKYIQNRGYPENDAWC